MLSAMTGLATFDGWQQDITGLIRDISPVTANAIEITNLVAGMIKLTFRQEAICDHYGFDLICQRIVAFSRRRDDVTIIAGPAFAKDCRNFVSRS